MGLKPPGARRATVRGEGMRLGPGDMVDLAHAGGWLVVPLALASVVALAICIERAWVLRRARIVPPHLLAEVADAVGVDDTAQAKSLCTASALGRILLAGFDSAPRGRDGMREAMEDAAGAVVHDLERYLTALGTIAAISPLLGLLGTVIGMIRVFAALMRDQCRRGGGVGGRHFGSAGNHGCGVDDRDSGAHVSPLPAAQGRRPHGGDGAPGHAVRGSPASGAAVVMFRRRRRPGRGATTVELTPLIDVVLLLLIFFMVSTTFKRESVLAVELPEAQGAPREPAAAEIMVRLDASGTVAVNDEQLPDGEVGTVAGALARASG